MKKVIVREKPLTRQCLANPHNDMRHEEKLVKSKAIDLRDNHTVEVLESGYWCIKPIDENKFFK